LTAAFVSMGVNEKLTNQHCQQLLLEASNPENPPAQMSGLLLDGIQFHGAQSGGVAGGTSYDERDYTAYHQGVCYEVSIVTAVSTALLQDPVDGDVALKVDLGDVDRRLNSILSTIKIMSRIREK
jgi:hypothetical protein